MGPDGGKHARNAAIVVALALVVWLAPGGSEGGAALSQVLSLLFLAGLFVLLHRLYREYRISLLDLPPRSRGILYGSFALVAFAIVATGRLWNTGPGVLIWLGLLGVAGYGIYGVLRATRAY